jgi:hypothetical protein
MKQIVLTVILVVVAAGITGGVGYSLGTQNGLTQAQSIQAEFFRQRTSGQGSTGAPTGQQGQTAQTGQGQPGQGGALGQRGGIAGTVKSVEGNVIQLTGQDGNTLKVQVDDRTMIQRNGTLADIRASTRITVTGDSVSGTVTARLIQVGAGQ